MIRTRQRRATNQSGDAHTREDEERFDELIHFLGGFITELNDLSSEGWDVLVEGRRDADALRSLGCSARILTMASLGRAGRRVPGGPRGVVILTDSDREGRQLAARCAKKLTREGIPFSLEQRRRLLAASGGVFRHVENLVRFSGQLERGAKDKSLYPREFRQKSS